MTITTIASGSKQNCYIISDGSTNIMIECGVTTKLLTAVTSKLGISLTSKGIHACLISHEHQDHASLVMQILLRGIDIYASRGTLQGVGIFCGRHVHAIQHGDQFTVGTMTVTPFDVHHDCAEPLGFGIYSSVTQQRILFATDTSHIRYKVQAEIIMIECNYSERLLQYAVSRGYTNAKVAERIRNTHMSLERVIDMLQATPRPELQQIHLLHLSGNHGNAYRFCEAIRELYPDVTVHANST